MTTPWFNPADTDGRNAKPKLIGLGLVFLLAVLGLGWAFSFESPREKKAEPSKPAPLEATAVPGAPADAKKTDGPAPKRPREAIAREPLTPSLGRVFFYFGVLVIGVTGAAWITKKLLARTRLLPQGARVLKLVDAIPLGPRRQVYVLNAYGRRLVVGAAGDRMTLLTEIAAEDIEGDPKLSFDRRLDEAEKIEPAVALTEGGVR